ncbi:hypothetical protein FSP39_025002 [Pinctada imbricata]|uniref:Hexosyltransferase n=1 Tax=Pinctada imbricata TaxID=66713 RepID=A0AA88YJQ5_PINIB|nr:hypothetical protein FSP39_025002 [Pinctada imbricata]
MTNGDILQGDFEDTYNNLTLKTMMGVQWISRFCPTASFVFLVDDDVIVNFHNLLKFTSSIADDEMSSLFSGCVHGSSLPIRTKGKWLISKEDFPFPCYPTYVSGTAVVTTGKVIQRFNAAIPYVKFLVFEDVFLGIVAWKLGIQPRIENSKFDFEGKNLHRLPCIITSHRQGIQGDVYEKKYQSLIHLPCQDWIL